ncbi:DUF4255 domain-containing protein [Paraburkholderia acidiphila]|uniref:DUF4255 domain-containing protein n=1 Tax=Paraburkholderia acidiphila TaxID=2571747 RepID=A0A7Z2JCD3_9BURK|nr:DUF4255 domain-containing protein [Paraburkholderia acidiphila]QGZ59466.1 DUF4255 domain-containing protein [Paraburkholderia acidiphila]
MSNGLALSGVTAVLQDFLRNAYAQPDSPFASIPVTVSCLAPDQVQASQSSSQDQQAQVNLFLHQVTHNAAWRNVDLPSMSADGQTRLSSPPLALDLHYLLTVYGSQYWESEALLGCALTVLHENPVLVRADIAKALASMATPTQSLNSPLWQGLPHCGLADQIEMIKITPATLGREEMAWLWTALKADYRLTFPFQASVVLIEPALPASPALPVLHRRLHVDPAQAAQLLAVTPPHGQLTALSTDKVDVTGEFLSAITTVLLSNPRYGIAYSVPAANVTATSFSFVPDAGVTQPAGVYTLSAQAVDAKGNVSHTTNTLPLALAPTFATQNATVVPGPTAATLRVTVSFKPPASPGQSVSLALTSLPNTANPPFNIAVEPDPKTFLATSGTVDFLFPSSLPNAAPLLGRLVVDGVSSLVQIDTSVHPPAFVGPMVTV